MLIIDADPIPYRCSNAALYRNLDFSTACKYVDNLMFDMHSKCKVDKYVSFIENGPNFRVKVDTSYKDQRDRSTSRAGYYYEVKQYFIDTYKPYLISGIETDDACVIMHQRNPGSILASVDKDLLQSPGIHYNYANKEFISVTDPGKFLLTKKKVIALGSYKIWHQMLMGDRADNISGIPGLGQKKAYNLLKGLDLNQMRRCVYNQYIKHYGEAKGPIIFKETFELVYIIRKSNKFPYNLSLVSFKEINKIKNDKNVPLLIQDMEDDTNFSDSLEFVEESDPSWKRNL